MNNNRDIFQMAYLVNDLDASMQRWSDLHGAGLARWTGLSLIALAAWEGVS